MSDVFALLEKFTEQGSASQISLCDLQENKPYPLTGIERTSHPQFGSGVKAYINNDQNFVYLTGRFRAMSQGMVDRLSTYIEEGQPPAVIYLGAVERPSGRAYNMRIVKYGGRLMRQIKR